MKTWKKVGLGLVTLGLGVSLVACGNKEEATVDSTGAEGTEEVSTGDYSAALVTDLGGVDDKSFNQSAWEGLQDWGKENDKEEGKGGYNYYQSDSDSEFIPNLNTAVDDGFNTVFGIGFKLQPAIEEMSDANPDTEFVIIDDIVEGKDNVASVIFKDNEASYLAGVAAAMQTKNKKVGFVGGQAGVVIDRFEAGFVAGVKSVDEDIEIDVQYAESFGDAAKGKSIAAAMYADGVDVIFHASGDTGNGVFSEAIDIMKTDPADPVWVIGVDRDQEEEGVYDGGNVTLTSTLKAVGTTVKDIANKSQNGEFPGGEVMTYGLKDQGVELSDGQLTDEIKEAIEEAKEKIISGDIEVPETPEKK